MMDWQLADVESLVHAVRPATLGVQAGALCACWCEHGHVPELQDLPCYIARIGHLPAIYLGTQVLAEGLQGRCVAT